jgi:hypothetical protein
MDRSRKPVGVVSRKPHRIIGAAGVLVASALLADQASADSLTPTKVPNLFVNEDISQRDVDALMLDLILPETQASDTGSNLSST